MIDAYTYILAAELEFESLLLRLGYDPQSADLRAYQLTEILAKTVREYGELWSAMRNNK